MSGGHFEYIDRKITYLCEEMSKLIKEDYPEEVIEKFKITLLRAKQLAYMLYEVDYLVSGDTSEDSFIVRWDEHKEKYGE